MSQVETRTHALDKPAERAWSDEQDVALRLWVTLARCYATYAKAIAANPLDEIEGIGPARKRALLAHFGSAKAVSRAGPDDLKAVQGISVDMAKKIYDFFHEKRG